MVVKDEIAATVEQSLLLAKEVGVFDIAKVGFIGAQQAVALKAFDEAQSLTL